VGGSNLGALQKFTPMPTGHNSTAVFTKLYAQVGAGLERTD